jgi:hypothetical protein
MKFIIYNDYLPGKDGFVKFISKEDIARKFGLGPKDYQDSTIGVNWYWVRLTARIDNDYNLAKAVSEEIGNNWIPFERKRIISKLESLSFLERLKFLFQKKLPDGLLTKI